MIVVLTAIVAAIVAALIVFWPLVKAAAKFVAAVASKFGIKGIAVLIVLVAGGYLAIKYRHQLAGGYRSVKGLLGKK